MSYASLMVYVEIEGIPEQKVRIASELAKKFGAALIGLSARAVPPPFVAEGVIIEEVTEADIKQMQAHLRSEEIGSVASLAWIVGKSNGGRHWIFQAMHWRAKRVVPILSSLDSRPRAATTITDLSTRARFFSNWAGPR